MEPPKVNLEVKVAASNTAIKRDAKLKSFQTQLGFSLSSLGKVLTLILELEEDVEEKLTIVELLICDTHWQNSETKRNFLTLEFKSTLKEVIREAKLDEWLVRNYLGNAQDFKLQRAPPDNKSTHEVSPDNRST